MKSRALLITLLLSLVALSPAVSTAQNTSPSYPVAYVDAFGPVGPRTGWLLAAGKLYITESSGGTWKDVTPETADQNAAVVAVDFMGETGWVVAARSEIPDELLLVRTQDLGASWTLEELHLYDSQVGVPPAGDIYLDFVDESHGWLTVKHLTSSNFSSGDLFATADGGMTWERRTLPIGDPVHFLNKLEGYVQGGVTGAESYTTTDGGWTWVPNDQGAGGGRPGDAVAWAFQEGRASSTGWRLERTGNCSGEGEARECAVHQRLLQTADGGATWSEMRLPVPGTIVTPAGVRRSLSAMGESTAGSRTEIMQGHGFDKCEVAKLYELADWYQNSPYSAVNLYIGGEWRACKNTALSASYVDAMYDIGWRFIPTWVGPQAPCYGGTKGKMSTDPNEAYWQGVQQADWAADTLAGLGLTDAEGRGSVAYYDIEHFDYSNDQGCLAATQSFVTGWSSQMRARGHLAGVYTNAYILEEFANLPAPPDVVWLAHWLRPFQFRPDATVWSEYLDETLWMYQQRIRQYSGGHAETWGTTPLTIDCDVLDGVVAKLDGEPRPKPTWTPTPTPTDTPTPTSTPTPTNTPTPWTVRAWFYLPMIMQAGSPPER